MGAPLAHPFSPPPRNLRARRSTTSNDSKAWCEVDPLIDDQPPNVRKYPGVSQNVISLICGDDQIRREFVSEASGGASASERRSLTY
jgi:hypothetical protein